MNTSYKRYKIYTLTALLLSIVFAVFLTAFHGSFYDFGLGLYKVGSPSFLVGGAVIIVSLFFASAFFTLKRDEMPLRYPKKSSLLTVFASMLCALSMVFTLIMQFFAGDADHLKELYLTSDPGLATASLMLKISLVLSILGAIYFVLIAFTDKALPLLAALPTAWIFAVVLRIYYDMTFIITDPVRNFTVLALCSAALFLLSEIRYTFGKCSPCFFVFGASLATVLPFASGVSKVAFVFMGKTLFGADTAYSFFEIAIALFALSRLLRFTERKAFEELELPSNDGVSILAASAPSPVEATEQVSDSAEQAEEALDMPSTDDTELTEETLDGESADDAEDSEVNAEESTPECAADAEDAEEDEN